MTNEESIRRLQYIFDHLYTRPDSRGTSFFNVDDTEAFLLAIAALQDEERKQKHVDQVDKWWKTCRDQLQEALECIKAMERRGVYVHPSEYELQRAAYRNLEDQLTDARKELAAAQKEASDFATTISALEYANGNLKAEIEHLKAMQEWADKCVTKLEEGLDDLEDSDPLEDSERCAGCNHVADSQELAEAKGRIEELEGQLKELSDYIANYPESDIAHKYRRMFPLTPEPEAKPWEWAVMELVEGRYIQDDKIVVGRKDLWPNGPSPGFRYREHGSRLWFKWRPHVEDFTTAKWLPYEPKEET